MCVWEMDIDAICICVICICKYVNVVDNYWFWYIFGEGYV